MNFLFVVITKVPDPLDSADEDRDGNLADGPDIYIRVDDGTFVPQGHRYKYPVFSVGEIVIVDDKYGREVCYPGRSPSNWLVEYEIYSELKSAVTRAKEVFEESLK